MKDKRGESSRSVQLGKYKGEWWNTVNGALSTAQHWVLIGIVHVLQVQHELRWQRVWRKLVIARNECARKARVIICDLPPVNVSHKFPE